MNDTCIDSCEQSWNVVGETCSLTSTLFDSTVWYPVLVNKDLHGFMYSHYHFPPQYLSRFGSWQYVDDVRFSRIFAGGFDPCDEK